MSISRKPKIPIACPACKGKGVGTDGDSCWSCKGSCILLISKAAYAMLAGFQGKTERHRIYTSREKDIILGPGKPRHRLAFLHEEGYTDRTYGSMNRKYIKLKEEERERELKAGA